jgi:tetratricopeptide (TPR) repeat protein
LRENVFSQNEDRSIDSLIKVLEKVRVDSSRTNVLNLLSRKYLKIGDYEKLMSNAKTAQILGESIGYKKGILDSYHNLGAIYLLHGDYVFAVDILMKTFKIAEEIGNKSGIAQSFHYLGEISNLMGNYKEAIKNLNASLSIAKEVNNRL